MSHILKIFKTLSMQAASLLALIPLCGACQDRDCARFERYWQELLVSSNVPVRELACHMNGSGPQRTRTGYCTFAISPSELRSLVTALRLKNDVTNSSGLKPSPGCASLPQYNVRGGQIGYEIYNGTQSPEFVWTIVPGTLVFKEGVSLPPIFKGNARSSFRRLFFNATSNFACVDLEYPYS